ncbi:hypothetical protein L3Q82_002034 [Scortum barcoo]|uniref:Uncharacterized protein n=1 Tax=Scortum barcoo TaxID=214431 RepID=A0ACB8W1L6_9TELE|nr:hypothetical protein L3Q82_002034 [Scortum barcoo]
MMDWLPSSLCTPTEKNITFTHYNKYKQRYQSFGIIPALKCAFSCLCSILVPRTEGVVLEREKKDKEAKLAWNVRLTERVRQQEGEERERQIMVPPREPTVTCRSNTYPKGFYCSWHQLHPTYIPTTFEVDVQHNQRSLEVQKDPDHKNRCRVRFPEVFSSFPYKVNVTAVNALGKASTNIVFEESNIVKPDPPERVTATPIRFNARRLEVSWQSPATWPDIDNFPLKYFLRYRPLIREQWQHCIRQPLCASARLHFKYCSVFLFLVELSDSTSHTITDAYAGKEYIIQVAAKDTEIGTWSDWSVAVHATPWIEDPLPITSTTEVDFPTETKTSPIPSSNAPQKAEPPVGRAARLLTFFSPLLLGMLLLFM